MMPRTLSFAARTIAIALGLLGLCVASGCSVAGGPQETQIFPGEVNEGNIRFGLPSVTVFTGEGGSNVFGHGQKRYTNYFPGCQAFIIGTRVMPDGALSIVRNWTIAHDTFNGEYQLRNGGSIIGFFPPLRNVKPTSEELRAIFGKWIFFPGDDPSRVKEVRGDFFPTELVFNDGRPPAETMKPDR